jgi:hypothetical protein
MQRHPEFIKNSKTHNTTDLLLLFAYDSHSLKTIDQISKKGIVAFLGCTPGNVSTIPVSSDFQFIKQSGAYETSISDIILDEMPPPSMLLFNNNSIKSTRRILSCTNTNDKQFDTIPILFTGDIYNKNFLSLNAVGYWRWDFWPLSISRGEEQPFLFSEYLIAHLKEMLLSKISGDFYAYPEAQINSDDSTVFALSLPSELPIPTDIDITVTVQGTTSSYRKTSICKLTSTGSKLQFVKIPPLKAGKYTYNCEFSAVQKNFTCSDSLTIEENSLELSVQGQNTTLLNQFAQEVKFTSDSALNEFLHNLKTDKRSPVQDYFRITRSWMILSILFLLFALEWGLRRKYDLD